MTSRLTANGWRHEFDDAVAQFAAATGQTGVRATGMQMPSKGQEEVNPDCKYGKHDACNGDGWDMDADFPIDCPCDCHEKESRK